MAKTGVTITVETKTEIAPDVQARVSAVLSTYHDLKMQADLLYEQMEAEKAKIWDVMKEAGYEKIEVDGTPCTVVKSSQSKLDKQLFVQLGGSLEQLNNATRSVPKKPYLKIGKEEKEAA